MISIPFQNYSFRYQNKENGKYIYDIIRKKYVLITPEEWVRQNLVHYLIHQQGYPKGLISIEKEIRVEGLKKRYDIVVFDKERMPWMLVECKKPEVAITEKTLLQLMRYHQVLQSSFWLLSNGIQTFCGKVEAGKVDWLSSLPLYDL